MSTFFNDFDFSSADKASIISIMNSARDFISKAQSYLESDNDVGSGDVGNCCVENGDDGNADNSPVKLCPSVQSVVCGQNDIDSLTEYSTGIFSEDLLNAVKVELAALRYVPSGGANSPVVHLFGDCKYVYNEATKHVVPSPFSTSSTMQKVLETVRAKYGVEFNSILVNFYRDKHVDLGYHQDNEYMLDKEAPIITISVGAERRFFVTANEDDSRPDCTFILEENSSLAMLAGLQDHFVHRVAKGRSTFRRECGRRWSITVRKMLMPALPATPYPLPPPLPSSVVPGPPSLHLAPSRQELLTHPESALPPPARSVSASASMQPAEHIHPGVTHGQPSDHSSCPTAVVFGSSLTKGLCADRLSERGERVRVFCKPGAHFHHVQLEMQKALHKGEVCAECVSKVILVAGGNNAQNNRSFQDFLYLQDTFISLVDFTTRMFPSAKLNVFSTIPRKLVDPDHLGRIHQTNEFMYNVCLQHPRCRFINITTHYLRKSRRCNDMILNDKLFNSSLLHFNDIGTSVLAKVIIGVIYRPWPCAS